MTGPWAALTLPLHGCKVYFACCVLHVAWCDCRRCVARLTCTRAYSIIMLNTDAHNPMVKNKMSKEGFQKNNRGTYSEHPQRHKHPHPPRLPSGRDQRWRRPARRFPERDLRADNDQPNPSAPSPRQKPPEYPAHPSTTASPMHASGSPRPPAPSASGRRGGAECLPAQCCVL